MTDAFYIGFATFPPPLVKIGPIEWKWQQFFETQDGGSRHLEFWLECVFDMTVVFYVRIATFPLNWVGIGSIVKKWLQLFEFRDAGSRRFDF